MTGVHPETPAGSPATSGDPDGQELFTRCWQGARASTAEVLPAKLWTAMTAHDRSLWGRATFEAALLDKVITALHADLADTEARMGGWPLCPDGCGCRLGTVGPDGDSDADHRDCGCDGACTMECRENGYPDAMSYRDLAVKHVTAERDAIATENRQLAEQVKGLLANNLEIARQTVAVTAEREQLRELIDAGQPALASQVLELRKQLDDDELTHAEYRQTALDLLTGARAELANAILERNAAQATANEEARHGANELARQLEAVGAELATCRERNAAIATQLDGYRDERDEAQAQLAMAREAVSDLARDRDDARNAAGVPKLRLGACLAHDGRRHVQVASDGEWLCLRGLIVLHEPGDAAVPPDGSTQQADSWLDGKFTVAEKRSILEAIASSPHVDELVAVATEAARAGGLELALQAATGLLRTALLPEAQPPDGSGQQAGDVDGVSADELLRLAADALWNISKTALTVKTSLDKPYEDAPELTPWTRWMERPARQAHDVAMTIRKYLRARAGLDGGQ